MAGLNGIDTIRMTAKDNSHPRLLVLSTHCTEAYVVEALQAAAHGFLLKSADAEHLVKAINAVAREDSYFSPEVSAILTAPYRAEDGAKAGSNYSLRERESLQLLGEGKTLVEIGQIPNISSKRVKNHRNNRGK